MNYEDLIGKEIVVKSGSSQSIGIVAYLDPDIGFSIVEKEDKTQHLACGHSPATPLFKRTAGNKPRLADKYRQAWPEFFALTVKMIIDGVYDLRTMQAAVDRLCPTACGEVESPDCPFEE